MNYIITGSAGFIGFHTCLNILKNKKNFVIGIDNQNNYYDVKLKKDRTNILNKYKNFKFYKKNIENKKIIEKIFKKYNSKFTVIHLAAQAGVRYSLINPNKYFQTNLKGFYNIITLSQKYKAEHFVYASTSSVYGLNTKLPFNENDNTDHPIQFYAATKKINEIIAHSFSSIYNLPTTGLRFFTVYGPWGRPDMSLFKFVKNIYENKKIDVFNKGNHTRDFTYVTDVSNIIKIISNKVPRKNLSWDRQVPNTNSSKCPFRIINVGGNNSVTLEYFIKLIEKNIGIKAKKNFLNLQLGDIISTQADKNFLLKITKYKNFTTPEEGIKNFIDWYKLYYKL